MCCLCLQRFLEVLNSNLIFNLDTFASLLRQRKQQRAPEVAIDCRPSPTLRGDVTWRSSGGYAATETVQKQSVIYQNAAHCPANTMLDVSWCQLLVLNSSVVKNRASCMEWFQSGKNQVLLRFNIVHSFYLDILHIVFSGRWNSLFKINSSFLGNYKCS